MAFVAGQYVAHNEISNSSQASLLRGTVSVEVQD
jgi:hypothetical protein